MVYAAYSFEELMKNPLLIPKEKGVYLVLKNKDFKFELIKDKYYADDILTSKYEKVKISDLLYIGKANGKNGLYQRIQQYIKYGLGIGSTHKGGRAIFQLKNWQKLLVLYVPVTDCEKEEKEILTKFKNAMGTYPLANFRN